MIAKGLSIVAQLAAYLIIVVWLISLYVLYQKIGSEEIGWARLTALFGSLEAVAFAAAGALFGTQVQKERVAKAEKDTEKGKRLALMVKTSAADMKSAFQDPRNFSLSLTSSHSDMEKLADEILRG